MPYASVKELPSTTKKLSKHGKSVFRAAFNSAYKQYKGDESKAFAVAWAAANKVSDATKDQDEDDLTLTVPALVRLMEYGREKAKTDLDLHKVVEKVAAKHLKKGCIESSDLEGIADAYDPDQPRHRTGKWTSGPGRNAGKGNVPRKPFEVSREMLRKEKRDAVVEISPREVITPQLPSTPLPNDNYDQLKRRGARGSNSHGLEVGNVPLPTSGYGVHELTANGQINEMKGGDGRPLIFSTEAEANERAAMLSARTGLVYLSFRAD